MNKKITNIKNIRNLKHLSLLNKDNTKLSNGKVRLLNKILLNFSSNDYLGLSRDKELINESIAWTKKFGTSLSSSRLVSGSMNEIKIIEEKISRYKKKTNTLIMGSGFQCNSTVIPAVIENTIGSRKKAVIFSDKYNHSSIHHGCLLSKQLTKRYRHLDYDHLESLIKKNKDIFPKLIVSETVFSMDGDMVDIEILRFLAKKYDCLLYLDEAHSSGVFGENGYGITPNNNCCDCENEIVVGTFSKAFGAYGSYVSSSKRIINRLINSCAGLIYSTALPPAILGSISVAVEKIPKLMNTRNKLLENSKYLKNKLLKEGYNVTKTNSQIIPILFSKNEICIKISQELMESGFYISAILPPTVPIGKSRLRISLTKFLKKKDINNFIEKLKTFKSFYE